LNDAPDKAVEDQIDNQRLLPGEGIIDLASMLNALNQIGYHDYASVETFSDTLPLLGAKEAALRTRQALDSVLDVLKSSL
jgi:sugar phosphate isomerase/epimerase